MRYCPKCESLSADPDAPTCPACGTVLVPMDQLPPEDLDRSVVLTCCRTLEEAMVLRAALAQEGIDSAIEDEGLLEIINPFHGGLNAGPRVMVRLADAEAALDFLRRKDAGELAISEDDLPEEGTKDDQPT